MHAKSVLRTIGAVFRFLDRFVTAIQVVNGDSRPLLRLGVSTIVPFTAANDKINMNLKVEYSRRTGFLNTVVFLVTLPQLAPTSVAEVWVQGFYFFYTAEPVRAGRVHDAIKRLWRTIPEETRRKCGLRGFLYLVANSFSRSALGVVKEKNYKLKEKSLLRLRAVELEKCELYRFFNLLCYDYANYIVQRAQSLLSTCGESIFSRVKFFSEFSIITTAFVLGKKDVLNDIVLLRSKQEVSTSTIQSLLSDLEAELSLLDYVDESEPLRHFFLPPLMLRRSPEKRDLECDVARILSARPLDEG